MEYNPTHINLLRFVDGFNRSHKFSLVLLLAQQRWQLECSSDKIIMPRIQIIHKEEATGRLLEIYEDLVSSRGKLANVHKIHSLHPESLVAHMDLYMTIMFGKSPLKRYQRELLGVITSKNNQCTYCVKHHAEALNFYWKDEVKSFGIAEDYLAYGLSEVDVLFCRYAELLTLEPSHRDIESIIQKLKLHGTSDRAILDATMIVSYFNFVNRIVLGLAVKEEEETGGYKY